jgi:eukaryotic-like serine/threonine-protein kinase
MSRIKHLIVEAHRRSIWQVLGVYLFSGWIVLQVVGELTRTAGLPPWVPPFALVLLLIGLPIVLATAVVQEGGPGGGRAPAGEGQGPGTEASHASDQLATGGHRKGSASTAPEPEARPPIPDPSPRRSFLQRHLTWKRALLGGAAAFTFLALLVGAYLVGWATGTGPGGSLTGRGDVIRGDRLVLADFGTVGADPGLGATVTDALRIDLHEHTILDLLEREEVRGTLLRMQRPPDGPLTPELAREVALREGAKAVLEGTVSQAGSGYLFTATLREAESDRILAPFREAASGNDDFTAALERLSRSIRNRIGEPLRSIYQSPGLERVTTRSLPALQRYTEAVRAFDRTDYRTAIALLEEAVELDPDFAMAWRALSVSLGNTEWDRGREQEAAREAYRLRDRLSERERYLTEANYHRRVTGDRAALMEAYRRVLRIDPWDRSAVNNLANEYASGGDYDAAIELLGRVVHRPVGLPPTVAHSNLIDNHLRRGSWDEALRVAELLEERHPESLAAHSQMFWVLLIRGQEEEARSWMEQLLRSGERNPQAVRAGERLLAGLALWRGRLAESRERRARAEAAGAEIGASPRLVDRLFRIHAEFVAGNDAAGLALLREAESQGLFAALPPSDQWHFFHANLLGMIGRVDEAEAVLRRFRDEVPESFHEAFHVRNESARFYIPLHRGNPDEAIGIIEAIRTDGPCPGCYAKRMGLGLVEAGLLQEGVAEWEAALGWRDRVHAPEWHLGQNLWILQRIGPVYEALGETEKALAHYRRMVDQWADADPELQPRVREWRERIAVLEGAR